jgi:hypothetical protein
MKNKKRHLKKSGGVKLVLSLKENAMFLTNLRENLNDSK